MTEQANAVRDRRLVRARVKPVEMLPEWAKCCERMASTMPREEIVIFEYRPRLKASAHCGACGHECPAGVDAMDTDGFLTPVEWLDFDEGPYQEAV